MEHQRQLRLVPGVVLTLLTLAAVTTVGRVRQPQPSRPNILFVLADDLDAAELTYLPKINALLTGSWVRGSG